MTKIYGYDTNVYETSIGNIKDMIEPIQDWKVWEYSCTDEEVKRAMTDKSYIEIILEEKDKEIERLNNIINKATGIANERINYCYNNNDKEQLESWDEIFDTLQGIDENE